MCKVVYTIQGQGSRRVSNLVCGSSGKSMSEIKAFVPANAIYSLIFAGHDTFPSTFVATY